MSIKVLQGNGNSSNQPKFAKPQLCCPNRSRTGCKGTMPLHTAKYKIGQGEKPECRECGRKYALDEQSKQLAKSNPQRNSKSELADENTKLKAQLAELQGKQPEASPKDDLKKLQGKLELAKEFEAEKSIIEAIEAKIKQCKEEQSKQSNSLAKCLRELSEKEAHAKQMAAQVIKDEDRLRSTKEKARAAAEAVIKLKAEKARLWVEEGHDEKEKVPSPLDPNLPAPPASASDQQQAQWKKACEDFAAQQTLFRDLLGKMQSNIEATLPSTEGASASAGTGPEQGTPAAVEGNMGGGLEEDDVDDSASSMSDAHPWETPFSVPGAPDSLSDQKKQQQGAKQQQRLKEREKRLQQQVDNQLESMLKQARKERGDGKQSN
jgi:hypothetical protein